MELQEGRVTQYGDEVCSAFNMDEDDFEKVSQDLPKAAKNNIMTLYDRILKKGENKGLQKGEITRSLEVALKLLNNANGTINQSSSSNI